MSIFAEPISRPIGAADMEFYYGGIVLRMALIMSGHGEEQWERISTEARIEWLNRARTATCKLFNDSEVVNRLPLLMKNLQCRA